jgi:hypothetical protein
VIFLKNPTKILLKSTAVFFAVGFLLVAQSALAAQYYVSPTGTVSMSQWVKIT